jgi:predicted nucleic acid-binding protein
VLLLDTSFLILYEGEIAVDRTGPARLFLRAHAAEPAAISLISVGEFAEGYAMPRAAETFLRRFRVLQLSRAIAYRMATLQGRLPQRLGENDAWIAATALAYGARIVGRDAAFRRVPSLDYSEV